MSVKEFAQCYIGAEEDAWYRHNFETLEKLEDPDIVYHFSTGPDMAGLEAHKQYIIKGGQLVPDIRPEWDYLMGEGNIFVLSCKTGGNKMRSAMPGTPQPVLNDITSDQVQKILPVNVKLQDTLQKKEITDDHIFICHIKNGRVDEIWTRDFIGTVIAMHSYLKNNRAGGSDTG